MSLSSKTSISVEWDPVTPGVAPGGDIWGYVLEVKDSVNGSVWEPFNGVLLGARDQIKYTARHLVPGREYKFRVTAYNFNGAGAKSNEFSYLSCIVPENFAAPFKTFTTKSTIGIRWEEPREIGGCDITGYAVYMKEDGTPEASYAEVNMNNDLSVRNRPGLNSLTINKFVAADLGKSFNIFVRAFTRELTHLDSDRVTILLADVPDKPPIAPWMTQSESSASKLFMNYANMDDSLNGGTMILSYSLEWDGDRGRGGEFTSLIGNPKDSLAAQLTIFNGIKQGELYRFRYRARNFYGWGPYSEVTTVLAA